MELSVILNEAGHAVEFGYKVWYLAAAFAVLVAVGALAANFGWLYKEEAIPATKNKKH